MGSSKRPKHGGSEQLSQNKFFDPNSCSMINSCELSIDKKNGENRGPLTLFLVNQLNDDQLQRWQFMPNIMVYFVATAVIC